MPGRTQHSILCELYWILLNYIEFSWIILNYTELYWIMCWWIGWITYLSGTLCRCCTISIHFRQQHNLCVQTSHDFSQVIRSIYPIYFPQDEWQKKTLWLPIHMPRSLTLHCKETFDDPFRTSQTLAALAAEGADERSLQELARRFQRTLAADREAKSGAKWELTCKTWDWSNLIVRIDLSIYLSIYIYVCVWCTHHREVDMM